MVKVTVNEPIKVDDKVNVRHPVSLSGMMHVYVIALGSVGVAL